MVIHPRTLRCANAMLYLGFTLIVWAAAVYVMLTRDYALYGYIGAGAAILISSLWGGYYASLRYEVDASGITARIFLAHTRIEWSDLTCAELRETRSSEIDRAVLHLETPSATLELSSDLLDLDDVRALARHLSSAGLLTTPLPAEEDDD